MSPKQISNIPASIHHRLLDLARERDETLPIVLNRFVTERFLYRLSFTSHKARFVLKGAVLFSLCFEQPHRPTKDIDLLGVGDTSIAGMETAFRDICAIDIPDDGLVFDVSTMTVQEIREQQEYGGLRVRLNVFLGKARIPLQIDVGFGDAVTPRAVSVQSGSLFGFPSAQIRAYPLEAVVAEKLQAMVALDMVNSRMKDFYDMCFLSRNRAFDGPLLCKAVAATFHRRGTPIPMHTPIALTPSFYETQEKQAQWAGFVRKSDPNDPHDLAEVCSALGTFLLPVLKAVSEDATLDRQWVPGGPWEGPG